MNKYFVPLCDSLEMLRTKIIESYSPIIPIAPQLVSQSVSEMQQIIESLISEKMLSSLVSEIEIHTNYVEIPEKLIPENFVKNATIVRQEQKSGIKILSHSDALALIALIIAILSWLFPNPLSGYQSESETKDSTAITNEQGELIIEYLANLCEQLNAVTSQMDDSDKSIPEPGQNSSYTQSEVATQSAAIQQSLEALSVSDNIRLPSEAE